MNKQAISVSLDPDNLVWLRTQTRSTGCRSVSELLDCLIREVRTSSQGQDSPVRSVVGTIEITESDLDLCSADAAIMAWLKRMLSENLDEILEAICKDYGNRSRHERPSPAA